MVRLMVDRNRGDKSGILNRLTVVRKPPNPDQDLAAEPGWDLPTWR